MLFSFTGHVRGDLGPDQVVATGTGAPRVEKDIRSGGDRAVRARKRVEIKQVVSQESENEKGNERDQRVAHLTVRPQVEVGVAALIRRRTGMFSVSVGLVAEAMKGEQGKKKRKRKRERKRKRDLAVRKETEIMTKIEKDDLEVATSQVLLVHNQEAEVQIRSKENPKAGW